MNMHIDHLQNKQESPSAANTVLWVPSEKVVIHQIPQPTAPKRKWPELVAWQLEDRLLQRVEDMHFVIIGHNADNILDVLVVSKQTMQEWMALAEKAHLQNFSLIPDYLALPWEEGCIRIAQRGELLLVRNGPSSGFAASPDLAWSLIESLIEDSPEQLFLSVSLPEKMVPEIFRINTQYHPLELDWQGAKPVHSANLLTGEYRQKKTAPLLYKKWAFAALLLICLALSFRYIYSLNQDDVENRSIQARTPAPRSPLLTEGRTNTQQAPPPTVERAPRIQVNAELLGLVITPTSSYATIKVNDQPEKVFHIGDEIKRGQKVSEITSEGVTIEERGQSVELFLNKYEDLISQEQQTRNGQPGNNQDGFALANMFAAIPVQVENFESGLKLDSLSDEMKMLSDIREGDVVVQIGNNDIQELMSNPTLWASYSTNTELTVTVIRDGEEVTLIVNASSLSAKILPSLASEFIR